MLFLIFITLFLPFSVATNPESNILIINTIDGALHGFHRTTGSHLWSLSDSWGPLVKVMDEETKDKSNMSPLQHDSTSLIDIAPSSSQLVSLHQPQKELFIPEPSGEGNLYYYVAGKPLKVYSSSSVCLVELLSAIALIYEEIGR